MKYKIKKYFSDLLLSGVDELSTEIAYPILKYDAKE